jgi:hypothetical protein
MKVVKVICALFIFGFVSMSHAAVIFITWNDSNGNVTALLGADNVEVNGSFYNVRFLDGTCVALFYGCNDATDFVFNTEQTATAAAVALLSQVFVDGDEGTFDTDPGLTWGCSRFSTTCLAYTPFLSNGRVFRAMYESDRPDKLVDYSDCLFFNQFLNDCSIHSDFGAGGAGARVFAVWSLPVVASAPGAAMILLMGIAGLLVSQRRKDA